MIGWIGNIDLIDLLLGVLLGAFVGVVLDNYIKRPKLVVNGSGGGGGPGPGFNQNWIGLQNQPGLIGLRLGETTLFGKNIHKYIQTGIGFDRLPAYECIAHLADKATGEFIKPLWWRTSTGTKYRFTRTVTLKSGESADLMLFARLNEERSKYFVFEPKGESDEHPNVPANEARFHETSDFVIEVRYFYGLRKFRADVTMVKRYDGTLRLRTPFGGGSF